MMAATTTETAFQMMVSGSRGPRGTLEGKLEELYRAYNYVISLKLWKYINGVV